MNKEEYIMNEKTIGITNAKKLIEILKSAKIDVHVNKLLNESMFIKIYIPDNNTMEIAVTDRTKWKIMACKNCDIINDEYHPGSYINNIRKFTSDVISYCSFDKVHDCLLSEDAYRWLKSVNYTEKDHDERIVLIKAAKILYP